MMNLLEKPSYLALWPGWLELPVSAEVIKDHWSRPVLGFVDPHTLEQYADDFGVGPGVRIEMSNGATYTLQYHHPHENHPDDISIDGDWDHYLYGDRFFFEHIKDSLERALHLVTIERHEKSLKESGCP